jgi:hypothetical protein
VAVLVAGRVGVGDAGGCVGGEFSGVRLEGVCGRELWSFGARV